MIQRVSIQPNQIQKYTEVKICFPGMAVNFPLMSIDTDSYIVGAEIQSGIDFDVNGGHHCLIVGKGCSLAESITFMIDLNHDYSSVAQGELSFLRTVKKKRISPRKASIIIQNDVWIGHGATIMAGVTLHNGCVVAADAVVTKDVPPYAIVGGNPARILRYRFDEETVAALQAIAWWDWPQAAQWDRREDFDLPVQDFIMKYLSDRDDTCSSTPPLRTDGDSLLVLFIPDAGEPYPLYPEVLRQYCEKDRPNVELLIYMPQEGFSQEHLAAIESILQEYEDCDTTVTLQTGKTLNEHILFQWADYFVTTRCRQTVYRTCLADRYHAKILYGTDSPIFPPDLS